MKSRGYLKQLVAARIDEVIAEGSALENQNMVESPIETIEEELDNSADFVLLNSPIEKLYITLVSDKKFHHGTSVNDVDVRIIFKGDDTYSGHLILPADFFRFISMKMSDWDRSATELIPFNSVQYKEILNPYTTGNYKFPKVALVPWNTYLTVEETPYTIDKTFTSNVSLLGLFDAQTVDSYTMSTGDLLYLSAQTNDKENGLYVCPAPYGMVYTDKIAEPFEVVVEQKKAALEFFTSRSESATLDELYYIPRLKAHEMPDELIDAMTWVCASKAFTMLRLFSEAKIAMEQALMLMK